MTRGPAVRSGRGRPRPALARAGLAAALAVLSPVAGQPTAAPFPGAPTLSLGRAYAEVDGGSLYANVCQGCHMRDGRGAVGAAAYPSLVANADLASAAFATDVVLKGLRAMPPVGRSMDDEQVAGVINYVRSHFDNDFADRVTAADVKAARD